MRFVDLLLKSMRASPVTDVENIRELIKRSFGVSLSEVSVGRAMKRRGLTAQRPLYRAWRQAPALVDHWREHGYPKIVARAKQEAALILFADESGIRSDYHAGTTWAPEGRTPVVKATGARYGLNMQIDGPAKGRFRSRLSLDCQS